MTALATGLIDERRRAAAAPRSPAATAKARVAAERTLLATGGAGQIFRETTNPAIATGDGIAMAARAGARVADLEFVQFHPTVLNVEGSPRFLLSEALRGEGARLINEAGEAFMERYEPAGDLASRDLVSRAIVREAERTGAPVYLSMAHLDPEFVRRRFPTITQACAAAGLDLARDPIPVSPAAHYVMGGVETDLDGRTSVAGTVCGRRGGLHRRARRQPARQQFAARRARVRRAGGRGDEGGVRATRRLPAVERRARRRCPGQPGEPVPVGGRGRAT